MDEQDNKDNALKTVLVSMPARLIVYRSDYLAENVRGHVKGRLNVGTPCVP